MIQNKETGGQVLVELAIGITLLATVTTALAWLAKAGWERFKCAHEVFEETHAVAHGKKRYSGRYLVIETSTGFQATGKCGSARERVDIAKLENMAW